MFHSENGGKITIRNSDLLMDQKGHGLSSRDCWEQTDDCSRITLDNTTLTVSEQNSVGALLSFGGNLTLDNKSKLITGEQAKSGVYARYSAREPNISQVKVQNGSEINSANDAITSISTNLNVDISGSKVSGGKHLVLAVTELGKIGEFPTLNLKANESQLTGAAQIGVAGVPQDAPADVVENAKNFVKSNFLLENKSHWNMTGDSRITTLDNQNSTVSFAKPKDDNDFKTLTVTGSMKGDNGAIELWTEFEDDASKSDKIVLLGPNAKAEAGSALRIKHYSGKGAQTNVGILVVDTKEGGKTAADAFTLDKDSDGYRDVKEGHIVQGAYNYYLVRGGNEGVEDNWYLTSKLDAKPVDPIKPETNVPHRPEVGAYLENRRMAMTMTHHKWEDRRAEMGDLDGNAWIRLDYNHGKYNPVYQTKRKIDTYRVHFGRDLHRHEYDNGSRLDFGVMGLIGMGHSKTYCGGITAKGDVTSYNIGAYATWQQHPDTKMGTYVDVWTMFGWNKSEVKGQGLANETIRPRTFTVSAEIGRTVEVDSGEDYTVYLQPQAQFIWSQYRAKDHTENTKTVVSGMRSSDFYFRFGMRLYADMVTESGKHYQPFFDVNYWRSPSRHSMTFNRDYVTEINPGRGKVFDLSLGVKRHFDNDNEGWLRVGYKFGSEKYRDVNVNVGYTHHFR